MAEAILFRNGLVSCCVPRSRDAFVSASSLSRIGLSCGRGIATRELGRSNRWMRFAACRRVNIAAMSFGVKENNVVQRHLRPGNMAVQESDKENVVLSQCQTAEHGILQDRNLVGSKFKGGNIPTKNSLSIVFITAEVAPYSKTGGLADVCGSLPIALAARGHRVMVVSPRYMNGVDDAKYAGAFDAQCRIKLGCFDGEHEVAFFHEFRAAVDWIGFIGRLDYQKGPDIIQAAFSEFMQDDVQMVILGSGEYYIEDWMKWAETTYKEKFRGWVGFSASVAHQITAGCDILLMPSRFEPCGLNQLYAMRYGTIPVVHSTGGLRDTVEDYNVYANGEERTGTGWTFSPLSREAMMEVLSMAIKTYREDKPAWKGIMRRCMSQDFSWDRAALQYEQVFEWAMIDPPYA